MVLYCMKTRIVAKDRSIDPANSFSLSTYSDNLCIFLQNDSCFLSVTDNNRKDTHPHGRGNHDEDFSTASFVSFVELLSSTDDKTMRR